jgi:hypothetical protein
MRIEVNDKPGLNFPDNWRFRAVLPTHEIIFYGGDVGYFLTTNPRTGVPSWWVGGSQTAELLAGKLCGHVEQLSQKILRPAPAEWREAVEMLLASARMAGLDLNELPF